MQPYVQLRWPLVQFGYIRPIPFSINFGYIMAMQPYIMQSYHLYETGKACVFGRYHEA